LSLGAARGKEGIEGSLKTARIKELPSFSGDWGGRGINAAEKGKTKSQRAEGGIKHQYGERSRR